MLKRKTLLALTGLSFRQVLGIDLDVTNTGSIKSAAETITTGLISYYNGENATDVPGLLPEPYYWWEGATMFDTLIQYWSFTGDDQYNDLVTEGLLFQQGEDSNFMPLNQTKSLGNDDQATWALAAMSAAEARFPEPKDITWLKLAENVFDTQVQRWDPETCGGGLRWQIFPLNVGYDYKNSISNGNFFLLASHLARYTGNTTYSDWATKSFDWTVAVGLIDSDWRVFDGTHVSANCTSINKLQFSNNGGVFINGAANLYNITTGESQKKWKSSLDNLLKATVDTFFPEGIATEVSCEAKDTCTVDMRTFKGMLAQNLVDTLKLAPYTSEIITPLLRTSAEAAAKFCDGGKCGYIWDSENSAAADSSESDGLSNDISALSFVQALLVKDAASPVTSSSGGSDSSSASGSGTPGNQTTGTPTSSVSGTGIPISAQGAAVVLGVERIGVCILAGLMGSVSWVLL